MVILNESDVFISSFLYVIFAGCIVCTQEQDAKQRERSNSKVSGKSEGQVRKSLEQVTGKKTDQNTQRVRIYIL